MIQADKFMTPKELAEYLKIDEETLAVWRCKKTYPLAYVKVGGHIRYIRESIDKWIESRTNYCEKK